MKEVKFFMVAFAALGAVVTSACAQEFMIDSKGADMSKYYEDLQECKEFAEKKSVAADAVGGAVAGALVGTAIGAAIDSDWIGDGAAWGGIEGAADGVFYGYESKKDITRSCLKGRGYKVLD